MRPELKRIIDCIKASHNDAWNDPAFHKALDSGEADAWLREHCMRLRKPVKVEKGEVWVSKSSSGNVRGRFIKSCRILGLTQVAGYEAVLDDAASTSDFALKMDSENPRCESVAHLSTLSTDLLKRIVDQLPR